MESSLEISVGCTQYMTNSHILLIWYQILAQQNREIPTTLDLKIQGRMQSKDTALFLPSMVLASFGGGAIKNVSNLCRSGRS